MIAKRLLDADRRRRVPRQFSWVDQRLVRDGYFGRCTHGALALYLFLVTVCDAEGLSYYAERSLCERLKVSAAALRDARNELCCAGLVAYEHPLYQVLDLDPIHTSVPARSARSRVCGEAVSIGQVLHSILGGGR
ncbi:MAG: hypothetical protein BWK77_07435 [Verrucomicrobia bacterium A1]|nr:MAG: hypothetical protein BWK77_07435 [Verrucomicrobia bacterium A1]